MVKEIIIDITSDGMKVETSGFKGIACLQEVDLLLTAMSEDGVSSEVEGKKLKGEYYAKEEAKQRTRY